tara:strand:- start:206 stop:478 length:273 start_codon:yes stop_codon:yes gene_type:complete
MSEIIQNNTSLQEILTHHINQYLADMKDQNITDMYDMVIEQIEQPLFQAFIEHCKYNQSKAAKILGISRGTLRNTLKKHFDDKYCGTREQ